MCFLGHGIGGFKGIRHRFDPRNTTNSTAQGRRLWPLNKFPELKHGVPCNLPKDVLLSAGTGCMFDGCPILMKDFIVSCRYAAIITNPPTRCTMYRHGSFRDKVDTTAVLRSYLVQNHTNMLGYALLVLSVFQLLVLGQLELCILFLVIPKDLEQKIKDNF